jgi:endonuclease/exonuclease/phosphatase family metal-dependent hydrolase
VVVYWVDLPSNPLAWRYGITKRVEHHLRMLQGLPANEAGSGTQPIPRPDLIIGDFNIPTFSASIDAIVPADPRGRFQHASQASVAVSRLGSWPKPLNALGLDHALVAPDWVVSEYRLIDPAASEHMAQSMVLWPKPAR